MLRFANIIGRGIRTSLTDYFALPVVPVPFGYDARLQFVHESDAIGSLLLATTGPGTGSPTSPATGVSHRGPGGGDRRRPASCPLPIAAAGFVGTGMTGRLK